MSRRVLRGFNRHRFTKARLSFKRKGISNHDLSRLSGVSESTLRKWQTGEVKPNIDKLVAALNVLETPVSAVVVVRAEERTLVDLRVLAGFTQPQLAKAAGISTTTLSTLERGSTPLSSERAETLAPLLGVSVTEISAAWQRARDRPAGAPA
ncbi:MAG: helix-turn-helix domain-containing protein [Segniliparus sp.]|uniref:helix-turn-helix domain-containing protein n=1 Tax=Segniliparus sp. TaxID=2804064 RepID=UPI003F2B735D